MQYADYLIIRGMHVFVLHAQLRLSFQCIRYYSLEAFLVEMDGYYRVLPAISRLFPAITRYYRVLPGITGYFPAIFHYYLVLPGITGCYPLIFPTITRFCPLGHVQNIWDRVFSEIKSACGMTTAGTKHWRT